MSAAAKRAPVQQLDALDLHAIGRLVLSAGIGPRWDLSDYARDGKIEVVTCRSTRDTRLLEIWRDGGPSTGGARVVAECFLDELEYAGFRITRAR